ncbi:hypothetical protein BDN71DRAFT_1500225 [Pleurotus eryngii]|uniref:Uncharacterized protein n=1 Tax=Pleurotus eryngii TaxID=5323 RepID=A0A9P6DL97_PLEER|nr:hypothetical protein BDN71DRAFT_1500225 [Pleurotus eryngii]
MDGQDSQIEYSLGWQTITSDTEYYNTASLTAQRGQRGASFTLRFVGTSFKVHGRLAKANSTTDFAAFPNTTYAMNGGVPSAEGGLIDRVFYASPPLANTKHTLVWTRVGEGAQVIMDYITVELPVDGSVSPADSSSLPAIAIVGGAPGVSLFVVIALNFCLWWRLRVGGFLQRRSSEDAAPPSSMRISMESSSTSNHMDDVLVCAENHKSPSPPVQRPQSDTPYTMAEGGFPSAINREPQSCYLIIVGLRSVG